MKLNFFIIIIISINFIHCKLLIQSDDDDESKLNKKDTQLLSKKLSVLV